MASSFIVNFRKMLHRKMPEYCTQLTFGNTISASFIVSDKSNLFPQHDTTYYFGGLSAIYNYSADQDAWVQLPNWTFGGTFTAGTTGEFNPLGCPAGSPTTTATGGTTNSITTSLTIVRGLAGCELRCVGGTNIGYVGTITSNTVGPNATLTLDTVASAAFDNTSVFQMFTGSVWFLVGGTPSVFGMFDRATGVWVNRSVTGIPSTWGSDGQMVITSGRGSNRSAGFVNSTSTGSNTSTTLNDTGKAWPTNGWANSQVRIVSGVGAGQTRIIASNTGTALTVSAAWTTTPDNTSVYRIEGNDDYIYITGNGSVNLYRFTISTNTWVTLSPTAARGGAASTGNTLDWVDSVQDVRWTNETYSNHYSTTILCQNGRYLYGMRGNGANVFDVYDIAANTWISNIVYGNQMEVFSVAACSVFWEGYIFVQKDGTGKIFRFDVAKNILEPWVYNSIPQGVSVAGRKMFTVNYIEGSNKISYLYTLSHTRADMVRWLIV